MPIVSSILLALFLLSSPQTERIIVHIPTSDAIDFARMIARDEGYDVRDTKVYYFDLLMTQDGKPLLQGYTSIGFDINGYHRNTISINDRTGQAIDMFSCEVFDYPDLRPFQENIIHLSKAKRKSTQELADDAGCRSPKVQNKPVPHMKHK